MIPREWIESLVRIAVLMGENAQPTPSVSESFETLMMYHVLPYGVQANTEAFRESLEDVEVGNEAAKRRARLASAS